MAAACDPQAKNPGIPTAAQATLEMHRNQQGKWLRAQAVGRPKLSRRCLSRRFGVSIPRSAEEDGE
jgi:hypothetical protein